MYSFFIDGVRLPVTPGSLETKIKNKNKVVTLLSGDEINILKAPGLTEMSFDMLVPSTEYPFARYDSGFKPPSFFLTKLEDLKASKKAFQFIASRTGPGNRLSFETNLRVSLEDYSILENVENGTDLTVKVKLKQYRDYRVKKVIVTKTAQSTGIKSQTADSRPSKEPEKTYTVKSGDTLWKICRKELGDGARYPEVAKLNDISNPNLIIPGQVIRFG